MISYIIWAIVLYVLFRFIFHFVIPLIRAGKLMRSQINDFQEKMNQQQQQSAFNGRTSGFQENVNTFDGKKKEDSRKEEDYIDFEEVK